jgi:hypothetical protein
MGMEYKVKADLDKKAINDLTTIIKENKLFHKSIFFNGEEQFEFRKGENIGSMPNFIILIQTDGIYINKHDSTTLWQDIEDLKLYFDNQVKLYSILDYQE